MLKFIATLSALTVLFSLSACSHRDTNETTAENTTIESSIINQTETQVEGISSTTPETSQNETTEKGETTIKNQTTKQGETTKKVTQATTKSNVPQTKAEIITYLNTAMNKVKSLKAGFDRHSVLDVEGSVENIPDFLVNAFREDEKSTVKKGENSDDIFPAEGFSWSSKLIPSDVKSADISVSGNRYKITLKFGTEKNPAKGASSYGRIMSVIDKDEAKKKALGFLKEVDMTYHDGYVIAEIDSKTGKLTFAELSATANVDIVLKGSSTHRKVNDIKSTGTYTNFIW